MFDGTIFETSAFQGIASPPLGQTPGIVDEDPAETTSTSGVLRAGAGRADYLPGTNWVTVEISDEDKTDFVKLPSINTNDVHGEEIDTANFTIQKMRPQTGSRVVIYNNTHAVRLFGGAITAATQAPMYGAPQPEIWQCNCTDWNYFLNKKKVWARYTSQPADGIVRDAIAKFSFGISTNNVKSGAPTIYEVEFGGIYLHELLTRIANRVGWHWYIDEQADVHFYDVEEVYARPIEPDRFHWWDLSYAESVEQLRNRVWGEGGGGSTIQFTPAGSFDIYLDTVSWYPTSGPWMQITAGGQILKYSSVDAVNKRLVIDPTTPLDWSIGIDTPVNVLVMVEDVASQQRMAKIEGGGSDGIHEFRVSDGRFGVDAMLNLAQAEMIAYNNVVGRGSFKSFDDSFRAGRFVDIRLPGRGINVRAMIGRVATQVRAPRRYFEKQVDFTTAHYLDFYDVIRKG